MKWLRWVAILLHMNFTDQARAQVKRDETQAARNAFWRTYFGGDH